MFGQITVLFFIVKITKFQINFAIRAILLALLKFILITDENFKIKYEFFKSNFQQIIHEFKYIIYLRYKHIII